MDGRITDTYTETRLTDADRPRRGSSSEIRRAAAVYGHVQTIRSVTGFTPSGQVTTVFTSATGMMAGSRRKERWQRCRRTCGRPPFLRTAPRRARLLTKRREEPMTVFIQDTVSQSQGMHTVQPLTSARCPLSKLEHGDQDEADDAHRVRSLRGRRHHLRRRHRAR